MSQLDHSVQYIKGIGERRAQALKRLGIHTLRDLLCFFPRSYEDRTKFQPIGELLIGENACVSATVASDAILSRGRQGLDLVRLQAVDDTGKLDIVFFNQAYVRDQLKRGEEFVFYGKVTGTPSRPSMANPLFESAGSEGNLTGRIVPIYRLTSGISQKVMMNAVRSGLDVVHGAPSVGADTESFPDALPDSVREKMRLAQVGFAYENIHFPRDFDALQNAGRTLIFEELFVLATALRLLKGRRVKLPGIELSSVDFSEFYDVLPFRPTNAQFRAIGEAVDDMRSGLPMNRLVQGDVGSGKTLVAAACVWFAWKNGRQSAFMAPTEILAQQHFSTLTALLEPLGMRVGLLTGSMGTKQKRDIKSTIAFGQADLIVGTHALLSDDVQWHNLALVITDEQHRFGVDQRAKLAAKSDNPHILVMSATPIPRTLALMIYGDLDVSVIDELPPGRQKIDTFLVGEETRGRIYDFIRRLVGGGRQIFIVCPMIDENEELSDGTVKSAAEYAALLQTTVFPDLRVGCVHGRLKASEKDRLMSDFVRGDLDILVSTTVIEVGVDVPNAALMVVENAEYFGLSQLHQLRGRVGRGVHKSYCVLFSDSQNETSRARLQVMCETNDGFVISEEDLRLRGPGDFFGARQHGLPEMRIADLCSDMDVLRLAQGEAFLLLDDDPELEKSENAPLLERIVELFDIRRDTFS